MMILIKTGNIIIVTAQPTNGRPATRDSIIREGASQLLGDQPALIRRDNFPGI